MRIRIYFLMFCIFSLLSSLVLSELIEVPSEKWMNSNDININIELENDKYRPGDSVYFRLNITNNNEIPLSGGEVKVIIYYKDKLNTKHIVDEIILKENIYLKHDGVEEIGGFWTIPRNIIEGKYFLDISYSKNLLGPEKLELNELASFDVLYGMQFTYIDIENLSINNNPLILQDFIYISDNKEMLSLNIPLINYGSKTLAKLNYNIYKNNILIDTKKTDIILSENSKEIINFEFLPKNEGVYLLNIHMSTEKNNNIKNIILVISDNNIIIDEMGISKFPINKGDKISMFICVSKYTNKIINMDLEMGLLNGNDEVIFLDSKKDINLENKINCYESSFSSNDYYKNITLFSKIINNENGDVKNLNRYYEDMTVERSVSNLVYIILILLLIILFIIIYIHKNKN
jgi:hypothetical protein